MIWELFHPVMSAKRAAARTQRAKWWAEKISLETEYLAIKSSIKNSVEHGETHIQWKFYDTNKMESVLKPFMQKGYKVEIAGSRGSNRYEYLVTISWG